MQLDQAALLYGLQKLDLQIARLRARMKEIDAALNSDEDVARAAQRLDSAGEALKPWQARARDLELELKSIAAKIQETDGELYGGKVKNPKALQEMQEEVDALKRRQSQLEDALLDVMVKTDEGQAAVANATDELAQAKAAQSVKLADLVEEQKRLEGELAAAGEKRKEAAARIDPAALKTYETLRPRMRGTPVALLRENGCTACGVEQTSTIAQQVRQGRQLVLCASCGRILAVV